MSQTIQPPPAAPQQKEHPAIAFLKAIQRNIFTTRKEAEKFLKTPEAKEKKMVLWVVRKSGPKPCFMVDTPERIKSEKEKHRRYSKMGEGQKTLSVLLEATLMAVAAGTLVFAQSHKDRAADLKAKYAKSLDDPKRHGVLRYLPTKQANELLEQLSSISFRDCQVDTMSSDIYIWLLGIKGAGIRKDLDLFNVRVSVITHAHNRKVRHIWFRIYNAKKMPPPGQNYGFVPGRTRRNAEIEVPGKTGASGVKRLMSRLKRALVGANQTPKPRRHIQGLYALTSIPNLRKVIKPVEDYLGKLYPQLFKNEDYRDWGIRRVKKTLDEVVQMKESFVYPAEKPLAPDVDETARVLKVLVKVLNGWHKHLKAKK